MGNIRSVAKAFETVGARVEVTAALSKLRKAKALILPGVGAFSAGMKNLWRQELIPELKKQVKDKKPFLGICLGGQLIFSSSEEHGRHSGLNFIPGEVKFFRTDLKIPHMGWNTITVNKKLNTENSILKNIPDDSYFYFVHSYYFKPEDEKFTVATCEYGEKFACIVTKENIYGIQFHPEKSSDAGLKILKNFC